MPKRDRTSKDNTAPEAAGTITIEADSVEEAMQRLATEVGDSAEIVDARKVQRGGIGGFFAKERVQLTARAAAASQQDADGAPGLADVLDRMTRDVEAQETEFATMLRRELGAEKRDLGLDTFLEAVGWDDRTSADEAAKTHTAVGEIAAAMAATANTPPETPHPEAVAAAPDTTTTSGTTTSPAPPVVDLQSPPPIVVQRTGNPASLPGPALIGPVAAATVSPPADLSPPPPHDDDSPAWRTTVADQEPAGMGPIAWRTMDLVRHGIPTEIVAAVADIDPNDDAGWITGLAGAIAPYCGGQDQGDTVLIGTNAYQVAEALGIEWVDTGQTAPYEGSFASYISSDPADREWLDFVRGKRNLHYVIGADQAWRDAMVEVPNIISWFDESALIDALYLAVACDAQLGYGVLPGKNDGLARVYPIDVALAIRSMMERS